MSDANSNEKTDSLSFGRYLKAERLQKGINLDHIFNETKISVKNLMNIEMENHSELPAEVFVKSYLRSYALCIGVDDEEVIRRYQVNRTSYKESYRADEPLNQPGSRYRLVLIVFIGLLLSGGLFFIFTHRSPKILPNDPSMIQQNREETAVSPLSQTNSKPADNISEKLLLTVDALENTWIKIIIDDQDPRVYTLKSLDHLTIEASKGYNLLIGNSASVRLTLNGKPVNLKGKSEQALNIELP